MSISGSIPAHSYYGSPVTGIVPVTSVGNTRPATAGGPFVGRGNKCSAKDDTCEGNRVSGEVFCAGHLRSARKAEADAVANADVEVMADGI